MSRHEQYQICKQRGHQPEARILASDPPWNVCKHCGTHYRTETKVIERNVPVEELGGES